MGTKIHSTAVVENKAELGENVSVGPHSFIENGAVIGDNTEIGSSVWVTGYARIGRGNKIYHGASIGGPPQDLKFKDEPTTAELGDRNLVREFVTIHRGSQASKRTIIGNENLIMAYVHIAHDCRIGDNIILANSTNFGGHCEVGDFAILGGMVPIHQFCRIGDYAMVGTGARITQDIVPYALVGADPTRIVGINRVGLTRRNFSEETRTALKHAFRMIFYSKMLLSEAVVAVKEIYSNNPEIRNLVEFIASSQRGILLKSRKD